MAERKSSNADAMTHSCTICPGVEAEYSVSGVGPDDGCKPGFIVEDVRVYGDCLGFSEPYTDSKKWNDYRDIYESAWPDEIPLPTWQDIRDRCAEHHRNSLNPEWSHPDE